MVGLTDIAPARETVTVGDVKVDVTGVSVHGLGDLFGRFPQLRDLMIGKGVDTAALMVLGPDIVVAIIAAGTGAPGDEAAEAAARLLPIEVQADFLETILRVTLPGGLGPFMTRLEALSAAGGVEAAGGDETPKQDGAAPSGKAPASKSPKRSKR